MPGTNPAEAMRVIAGELPDFPHLPELPGPRAGCRPHRPDRRPADRHPGRGHPARLAAGRAARPRPGPGQVHALLRPGRHGGGRSTASAGRSRSSCAGPWTLAATLELPRTLNVAIADPGAVADLTASLAEGAAAYAADVAKRVPGRPARRPVRRALAARRGRRARCRRRAGCRGCAASRPTSLRERLAQVIASDQRLHGGPLLRSTRPVRPHQGGRGRCRVLRPQPATAWGRGRRGRGRRGRAWAC